MSGKTGTPLTVANALGLNAVDASVKDLQAGLYNLGSELQAALIHHRAGRIEDAEALYRKLLDALPGNPHVLHLLGISETQRGQAERGVELIGRALPALSRSPELHFNLGNALRQAGKREDAAESYRRAIALKPDYILAHITFASLLGELGRFEAAVSHCRTAITIDPDFLPARITLATALQGARRLPEAAQAWREIIARQPDRAESYHQLAGQLAALGLFREALHCNDQAVALQPDNPRFYCARGYSLMHLYEGEDAAASFHQAIALSQNSKEGWTGLSWALRMLGRFDEAEECIKRLREIDPADLRAVRHVPSTRQQASEPAEIERLAAVLDRQDASAEDRITAGFAVGRLLEDSDRYDEAFARYAAANVLVRCNWPAKADPFDGRAFARSVDALIASNPRQEVANAMVGGNLSELPVFVVGMPRSGTTLIEQICASHSRIFGAGELDAIQRIAGDLVRTRNHPSNPAEAIRRAADAHIVHLYRLGGSALRVVDKMPDNVLLVGLIRRLFPRARFVFCNRDARDIALSCYFQLFNDGAQYFSYDLADCGRRCREVQRLAAYWLSLLPLNMIEVNYEKLVTDLEGESRRLIEFLGLDWEPACLDFHRTERTVATLSHWQVRQPLYTSSVGRWRHYEKHLGPLFAALDGG